MRIAEHRGWDLATLGDAPSYDYEQLGNKVTHFGLLRS
jgi:hypothetical protein